MALCGYGLTINHIRRFPELESRIAALRNGDSREAFLIFAGEIFVEVPTETELFLRRAEIAEFKASQSKDGESQKSWRRAAALWRKKAAASRKVTGPGREPH